LVLLVGVPFELMKLWFSILVLLFVGCGTPEVRPPSEPCPGGACPVPPVTLEIELWGERFGLEAQEIMIIPAGAEVCGMEMKTPGTYLSGRAFFQMLKEIREEEEQKAREKYTI
jgi:hypothetical protein